MTFYGEKINVRMYPDRWYNQPIKFDIQAGQIVAYPIFDYVEAGMGAPPLTYFLEISEICSGIFP